MPNGALFNALNASGRSGAPKLTSNTPASAEAGSPSPASDSLFDSMMHSDAPMQLPAGNLQDAMHITQARFDQYRHPDQMGPTLPKEPLPAEQANLQDTLGMVTGGIAAPINKFTRAAVSSDAAQAASKAANDAFTKFGLTDAVKRLFEKASRMMNGVRK